MENINALIEFEILNASYWEHFKVSKDLALILPIDHPRRIYIKRELDIMQKRLHLLKEKI